MKPKFSLNLIYTGFLLMALLDSTTLIDSQTVVKNLPGYPGPLPFKLETGYGSFSQPTHMRDRRQGWSENLLSTWFINNISNVCKQYHTKSYTMVMIKITLQLPNYPTITKSGRANCRYVGVGEDEAVQLFYYFVESERNPEKDPLIIWLSGGPGCSTLHGFFFEIGPMQIDYGRYLDDVPALQLHPYSWTKVASIIYLDAPATTGYSYTENSEAAHSSDTLSGSQTAEFIRKFVGNHPKFIKNSFYVSGISYQGIVIPMITEELYKGNEEGLEPIINIKGYMAINPLTDKNGDVNARLEYAYRMAVISKDLFESTKKDCNGEYADANPNNLPCMLDIKEIDKRVKGINMQHILEPNCNKTSSLFKTINPMDRGSSRSLKADTIKMVPAKSLRKDTFCRDDTYDYAALWANNDNVMKALNIRKGTVDEFLICIDDMKYKYGRSSYSLYEYNVLSSVVYHDKLLKRKCRALILSGDHDMKVSHVGTYNWINALNLTITDSKWDAWYCNDQVAGYKTTYVNNNYSLAYATIKGAGHTAPEYKPEECFEIVKRWFAHVPI